MKSPVYWAIPDVCWVNHTRCWAKFAQLLGHSPCCIWLSPFCWSNPCGLWSNLLFAGSTIVFCWATSQCLVMKRLKKDISMLFTWLAPQFLAGYITILMYIAYITTSRQISMPHWNPHFSVFDLIFLNIRIAIHFTTYRKKVSSSLLSYIRYW